MKFGLSLARTTPLPRRRSAKRLTASMTAGSRVGGRDQLEQVQVARRIEEVRAEEALTEPFASVPVRAPPAGCPDVFELTIAFGPGSCVNPREQRLLDVEPLDDGLDDPVGRRKRGQVGVEAAGGDQACGVGGEERVRSGRPGALQPLARELRR